MIIPRLAIIEDDPGLNADLLEFLTGKGFVVRGYTSAEEFRADPESTRVDLALLDIELPGASGLDLTRWLHEHQPQTGVVLLTCKGGPTVQIDGLQYGADAYLEKNVSLDVIEATCHSVLRRLLGTTETTPEQAPAVTGSATVAVATSSAGTWRLSLSRCQLMTPRGQLVDLTYTEAGFLQLLLADPGQLLRRDEILSRMQRPDTINNRRNLDNLVRRIRNKVEQCSDEPIPLKTAYGSGYLFAGTADTANALHVTPPRP